jgi:hypothetical protein
MNPAMVALLDQYARACVAIGEAYGRARDVANTRAAMLRVALVQAVRRETELVAPGEGTTIQEAQLLVGTWGDRTFPKRTVYSSLAKLTLEEIPEFLLSKADDPGEYADLLIMVLDVAHQKRIDAGAALLEKHAKNERRVWVQTAAGTYHHVEGAANEE